MENKRAQIIKAAIGVFARKGLERGKIADIARVAGIGKGTVYEYFRSKEEIFTAIETTVMGEMYTSLETIMALKLSPAEKLRAIMNENIDQIVRMDEALLIITELWAQAARGHWHEHKTTTMAVTYDQFRDIITSILQKGIDLGEFREMNIDGVATLLMAFIDGLAWQYVLLRDVPRFEKIKTETIRSFMKGIVK